MASAVSTAYAARVQRAVPSSHNNVVSAITTATTRANQAMRLTLLIAGQSTFENTLDDFRRQTVPATRS
ncbi:hypothetical protein Aple_047410 [Acrocarpospora pleiomorpha]|uniref:Uncharacterized protein n=1 Tax=Acrocarpospora pleiomorpha TaxID=90975 RepID=A0A5M3XKS0_9ACTN|nr:hypothetical protein Aple_047410 [Acrocarpospora pleiomorpha]